MERFKRQIECITALILVAVLTISVFYGSYPAANAAEAEDAEVAAAMDDLAESGYTHRTASFEGVPNLLDSAFRKNITHLSLSAEKQYLNINERCQLNVLDAYSNTINSRVVFSSSDNSVASVAATGIVTGKGKGIAEISATDRASRERAVCTVYVGDVVAPTEPAKPKPTDEPTEAPTLPPTQPPTAAPTQKPTTPPAPTVAPTTPPAPTQAAVTETLSLKASSATVYKGCYYHVVATSNTTVSFKSSNTSVASVNSSGIVTAVGTGTATITASTKTKSATCKITVKSGSSVNLSHKTATVYRFKTFMVSSSTSGVSWTSSDPSVASVTNKKTYGFIKGEKAGTAVITVSTSSGAASCLVTVSPSYPVQFAYSSPNCAAKNQNITLIAITDTMRTAVRFEVNVGSTVKYVNATSKKKDGDTYVWKGTTSFSSAGTYTVKAYSQFNNDTSKWSTCADGKTTAFVTSSTDYTTTVCTERRASDSLIKLIATFEGYSADTYIDTITDDDPTLGYGVLVFTGEQFYNNLTKEMAYAYLTQEINNSGYSEDVNAFLLKNKIKFNQQQFDALVCFAYNCGTGPLSSDDELIDALCDCSNDFNNLKSNSKKKQKFIEKLCAYHHAGNGCVYGLLYRRIDETEMFFYGDYEADYGNYKYPISYTCYKNKSFKA